MRRANSRSSVLEPGRRARRAAFSLVEIALALGIVAFAGVAILGLTSVSINSNRESSIDTVLAQMVQSTTAYLHTNQIRSSNQYQGFYWINQAPQLAGTAASNPSTYATLGVFYYDVNGQIMEHDSSGRPACVSAGTAPPVGSVYSCLMQARLPTPAVGSNPVPAPSLIYLRLSFQWPTSAPAANQQTRIVNASIANYD